jgi:hypothetical protein
VDIPSTAPQIRGSGTAIINLFDYGLKNFYLYLKNI